MSFIQWAVLTVIGLFTLTFCIFTIMDRILKYKETKTDKVDHSYLRDEINDLCNRVANLEDIYRNVKVLNQKLGIVNERLIDFEIDKGLRDPEDKTSSEVVEK